MKKITVCLSALVLLMSLFGSMTASALSTKLDYQYDENKHSISGPVTYEVKERIYGSDLGVEKLDEPSDIFIDENNNIYIADSGNNRVLIFDDSWNLLREISEISSPDEVNKLYGPKGVFAKNGIVYICDTENSRVVAVNENNEVIRLVKGEGLLSVNEKFVFKPEKLVVDSNDNILVSSSVVYQGIMRFNPQDEFKSFFAPNQVEATFSTFINSLLKSWFTDAQKESLRKNLPSPYSNLYISEGDFIYATAENVSSGQDMKCLNSSGSNVLVYASVAASKEKYGDYETKYRQNAFIDIHCDDQGYMLVADKNTQKLFLYDSECNLLSIFGGIGSEKKHFVSISSVEKLYDDYLILDSETDSITVMSPTEYIRSVMEAMQYYHKGEYTKSENIWIKLLENNSNFPFAYRSLGRAQYHIGNYKKAMEYLEMGGDTYFYSLALNGYRKELVQDNFLGLTIGSVLLIVGFVYIVKFIKKKLMS